MPFLSSLSGHIDSLSLHQPATWFAMGEAGPGSRLSQRVCLLLCAGWGGWGVLTMARNKQSLSGHSAHPSLEPSPRPAGPHQPGAPAPPLGSLPRMLPLEEE